MCDPAPACKAALVQATQWWPRRSHASDGICASPEHRRQSPNSDHNTGDAFDLTHDPLNGVDCTKLAEIARRDPRVTYVIWDRKIWSRKRLYDGWRPYNGANPHTKHMHVSIDARFRGDTRQWWEERRTPMTGEDRLWVEAKFREFEERIAARIATAQAATVGPEQQLDGTPWTLAELADLMFKVLRKVDGE